MKRNCWEYFRCGRESGGARVEELGTCPSAVELTLDGVHGGKNAGRACWVVSGTACHWQLMGTNARMIASCRDCDFYKTVELEEFGRAVPLDTIMGHPA